jgi:ribose 5-phosphate isomerase B
MIALVSQALRWRLRRIKAGLPAIRQAGLPAIWQAGRRQAGRMRNSYRESIVSGETIWIGNDHGGYELKLQIVEHLASKGIAVHDVGCDSTDVVRYPYYAAEVAGAVSRGQAARLQPACQLAGRAGGQARGILICSTGIGMSIIANKFRGVRAALCTSTYMGKMTRAHNNSNVLCLGGKTTGVLEALDILDTWLATEYDGGRHDISLGLIAEAEEAMIAPDPWKPSGPRR